MLIQVQRPDASVVMGYRVWQSLGHQVRRGEKSIGILAPCTYKAKRDNDEGQPDDRGDDTRAANDSGDSPDARRVLRGFRLAPVFDISSTDGDAVRPPAGLTLLDGEAPEGLWETLAVQVGEAGFTLLRDLIASGANGTTDFVARTVTVAEHPSPAQAAKTLAHELAHVCLHDRAEHLAGGRASAEVEAESVACVVCQAAGLTPPPTASATSLVGPEGIQSS